MAKEGKTWPASMDARNAFVLMGALFIIAFFVTLGGAIAGSYALTVHYVNQAEQTAATLQHQAKEKALELEVKSAIPECNALIQLDQAGVGATHPVPPGTDINSTYGVKLAKAIHKVVVNGQCYTLIQDVHKGFTPDEIVKDLKLDKTTS